MTPPRRFLFCIVGVGAGNTTRNLAILEELGRQGNCEFLIAAQGRAYEILSTHYPAISLREVGYTSSGEFSPIRILKENLSFPLKFAENVRTFHRLMKKWEPDLVVADSDFYCLLPARWQKIPVVAINNAAIIVETLKREKEMPASCNFSYRFIEKTDYWLQRTFPRRILCPTIRRLPGLPRRFVQIPPMVRPDIQPLAKPGSDVVVVTGGSGIDAGSIDLRAVKDTPIRMLGTPLKLVPESAVPLGFTLDVMEHFHSARVLVIQGGFSSVSEAVALRVPTVVVPISNHAEQWCNGRMLADLGMGLSAAHPGEAGELVNRILADYQKFWDRAQAVRLRTDGHRVAAKNLWRWAERLNNG